LSEHDPMQRTEHTEEAATPPEPQTQADGDSTPPTTAVSATAMLPEPDKQVTITLSQTDMQAFLLFSIAGFAVLTAGWRNAQPSVDQIEGAFNHVYDEAPIVKLVDGPLAAAVNEAFGEGMSDKGVDDLLRVFTA